MTTYKPDQWVVLKVITTEETFYKVLGTWHGGYTQGDAWRLNSGITSIQEDDDYFAFEGTSGSTYICAKGAYGHTSYTGGIIQQMIEKAKEKNASIEALEETTDFSSLLQEA